MSTEPSIESLAERLAIRLREALDQAGYPAKFSDRARALAAGLGLDVSVSSAMLSGHHLPDYPGLVKLCSTLGKEPGYFLDAKPPTAFAGLVAEPVGPGHRLLMQWPEVENRLAPGRKVCVFRAKSGMGFGVEAGDWLITASARLHASSLIRGALYLVGTDSGFDLRFCSSLTPQGAHFVCSGGVSSTVILPKDDSAFENSGIGDAFHHFGEVMLQLRQPQAIGGVDFQT